MTLIGAALTQSTPNGRAVQRRCRFVHSTIEASDSTASVHCTDSLACWADAQSARCRTPLILTDAAGFQSSTCIIQQTCRLGAMGAQLESR